MVFQLLRSLAFRKTKLFTYWKLTRVTVDAHLSTLTNLTWHSLVWVRFWDAPNEWVCSRYTITTYILIVSNPSVVKRFGVGHKHACTWLCVPWNNLEIMPVSKSLLYLYTVSQNFSCGFLFSLFLQCKNKTAFFQ